MAIINVNPRRTVWFSPNEPSNKYDIWLSRNAHLDENGETTIDSNSQRDCDYIFKIYDCGKWNPIVGFNSTAANKINTVNEVNYTYTIPNTSTSHTNNGFQQNHLPLFRSPEDSPDELFDAGTLGQALYGFVTEAEWNTLFNANWFQNAFNTSIIGGNSYNWNTLINSNIDFATTTQCGGILSATHPVASSAFKPIEVKFYPIVLGYYQNERHRLCVSASDVIEQINSYYNDNPSGPSLNIPLATTNAIGGIKSDVHSYGITSAFKPVECKLYPNQGSWSSLHERLCINANDVIDSFIDSFDSEYPLLLAGPGIEIGLTLDHSQITWAVLGLTTALDGKYARSKINSQNNRTIEWVDSPDTWRPIQISGTSILNNAFNITEGSGVTITTSESNGVTTATISANSTPSSITITEGEGIDVTTTLSGYEVGISLTGASLGKVLSYDGTNVVWANPQAGSYTAGTGVLINLLSSTISSEILIDSNNYTVSNTATFNCVWGDLITPSGIKMALDSSDTKTLEPFTYTKLTWNKVNSGSISFNVGDGNHNLKIYMKGDPVFIELDLNDASNQIISLNCNNGHYIDVNGAILNGYFNGSYFLITVQFGIVKIELMN